MGDSESNEGSLAYLHHFSYFVILVRMLKTGKITNFFLRPGPAIKCVIPNVKYLKCRSCPHHGASITVTILRCDILFLENVHNPIFDPLEKNCLDAP